MNSRSTRGLSCGCSLSVSVAAVSWASCQAGATAGKPPRHSRALTYACDPRSSQVASRKLTSVTEAPRQVGGMPGTEAGWPLRLRPWPVPNRFQLGCPGGPRRPSRAARAGFPRCWRAHPGRLETERSRWRAASRRARRPTMSVAARRRRLPGSSVIRPRAAPWRIRSQARDRHRRLRHMRCERARACRSWRPCSIPALSLAARPCGPMRDPAHVDTVASKLTDQCVTVVRGGLIQDGLVGL